MLNPKTTISDILTDDATWAELIQGQCTKQKNNSTAWEGNRLQMCNSEHGTDQQDSNGRKKRLFIIHHVFALSNYTTWTVCTRKIH